MYRCVFLSIALVACGPATAVPSDDAAPPPDGPSDDARADAGIDATPPPDADPDRATLRGRVWGPSMAPGLAPAGQEMPVFGAAVYVTTERPTAIPSHVYCDRCDAFPAGAALSSHDGSFTLGDIPAGDHWLVIQKGQFRLEQRIHVDAREERDLPATATTLPSRSDLASGLTIPRIAIALGAYDRVENVLGKLGFGRLNSSGQLLAADGELDLYYNGSRAPLPTIDTVAALISDYDKLSKYHIVFFPCSEGIFEVREPQVLRNLRRFVNEGGKIYATDWSGYFADYPFPPQMELGGSQADTVGTYNPRTLEGSIGNYGTSVTASFDSPDAEVVDEHLARWLETQTAAPEGSSTPAPIDPDHLVIRHNRNWVLGLHRFQRGTSQGFPVYDEPRSWIIGSNPTLDDDVKHPLSITFEPTGCGRVLYSTYHTSTSTLTTLDPQERILVFLLMEVSGCSALPPIDE